MKSLRSALVATGETTRSEGAMSVSTYHARDGAPEHELAIEFAPGAIGTQRADVDAQAPSCRLTLDMDQVVARPAILAAGSRRSRGDADHRHWAGRAVDPRDFASVIVPVKDEFAADPPDHRLERRGIGQALEGRFAGERRMVDQHDAAEPLAAEIDQNFLDGRDLCFAECPGGEERRLGHPAVEADQRDRSAPTQGGEDLEVGGPRPGRPGPGGGPQNPPP